MLVVEIYKGKKCPFYFIERGQFGCTAETNRKGSSHIFKVFCFFFLEKANLRMKGCKKKEEKNSSVVDTSGHKHRECIL